MSEVDTEVKVPVAYRVAADTCGECDNVHLDLFDEDDELIATAVMPKATAAYLIKRIKSALRDLEDKGPE